MEGGGGVVIGSQHGELSINGGGTNLTSDLIGSAIFPTSPEWWAGSRCRGQG